MELKEAVLLGSLFLHKMLICFRPQLHDTMVRYKKT